MSSIETKAVVVQEPQFAISISRNNIAAMSEQIDLLKQFIGGQLVQDEDYGRFGGAKKDSLLKAGAEKLKRLFNLGDRIVDKVCTLEDKFVRHSYTVEVYSLRSGLGIAQCVGIANSNEKANWKQNPMQHENSISKMAQKRAMVGAVISATNAGNYFTADMEDMDHGGAPNPPSRDVSAAPESSQPPEDTYSETHATNPGTPTDFMWLVGKFKGKRLNEIPPQDLANYVQWLGKLPDLKGGMLEGFNKSRAYLEGLSTDVPF